VSFEPVRTRQPVCRIEFYYTPKRGIRLNIAENELNSMTRQSVVGRRFGDTQTLRADTMAWSSDVNFTWRGVNWKMKIDEVLCMLKSVTSTLELSCDGAITTPFPLT
jgi:hypothetical protein